MIEVTSMKIGEFPVNVPVGLSKMLDGCWVKERKIPAIVNEYESKTVRRNGELVTILTKKKA